MILGGGWALGSRVMDNDELSEITGETAEWILRKSGITQRYLIENEQPSDLAVAAAQMAMRDIDPSQIALTVVCTCSHEYVFPAMSAKIHRELGLGGTFFDVQANCSGFVTALTIAQNWLSLGKYALIVGCEVLSPMTDFTDVESAMFLSDGAGALVVGKAGIDSEFLADTSNYEAVRCAAGDLVEMNGMATWRQAMTHLPPLVRSIVARKGWTAPDIILFHQANKVMIDFLMNRLGYPLTYTNVERIGNTGSASLPIVIAEAREKDLLHGKIVIAGIGAGFGFGVAAWEE
jgi:3-oxoacyl-[acyl-carrier-protein] synthase-3